MKGTGTSLDVYIRTFRRAADILAELQTTLGGLSPTRSHENGATADKIRASIKTTRKYKKRKRLTVVARLQAMGAPIGAPKRKYHKRKHWASSPAGRKRMSQIAKAHWAKRQAVPSGN